MPDPNYVFLYWLNESGRIISEQANYSFYLTYDTKLSAKSFTVDTNKRYVVFRDMNDKVLHSSEYTIDGNGNVVVDVPVTSGFTGFVFENWVDASGTKLEVVNGKITVAAGDANKAIMIKAKYRSADTEYTVTVTDGTFEGTGETSKTFKYGESCTVTAIIPEGKNFDGWYRNDKLVSHNVTYSFIVNGETELEARFSDTEINDLPVVTIELSERSWNGEKQKQIVVSTTSWSITNGAKFIGAGIVRTYASVFADDETLRIENEGEAIKRHATTIDSAAEGSYTATFSLKNPTYKQTLYIRGYLIYENALGEIITIYTDIVESVPLA